MPLERVARLEERVGRVEEDMRHLSANQEDMKLTLNEIAGFLRDQRTERRILTKIVHLIGWAISATVGYFLHQYWPVK